MVDVWIDTVTAIELRDLSTIGFRTQLTVGREMGRTIWLLLWRDEDADPPAGELNPQEVLVIFAEGGSTRRGDAAEVTNNTGEFRAEPPFDVRLGDRFTLPGPPGLVGTSGYVNEPPVDMGAYVRAPFRLEG